MGDGPEAAIALRQRLNETVEQLDELRHKHAGLEVNFENQSKELTIAKSDLTLVNKDQLDILASLRESVNEDKVEMEADLKKIKNQLKEASDKNRMQLEQINTLLLERVNLQGDSIDVRERMLARERDLSDLKRVIAGKDLPEDVKSQLVALHEEVGMLKEQYKESHDKLSKAKAFIKSQDRLFKEEQTKKGGRVSAGVHEESEARIKVLEEEVLRLKRLLIEQRARFEKEVHLLLGFIHSFGMNTMRDLTAAGAEQQSKSHPNSWLAQQRSNLGAHLRR